LLKFYFCSTQRTQRNVFAYFYDTTNSDDSEKNYTSKVRNERSYTRKYATNARDASDATAKTQK